MAILGILLPIFFLFLGFGEILKFRTQSLVGVGFIDFLIIIILIVWLFTVKKSNYKLLIPITIFVVIAFISLLINYFNYTYKELTVSSLYLVRFALYSSLYFVFKDVGKKYKTIIPQYMFLSGFVFLIIGYFQYVFVNDLGNYLHLGWDQHLNRLFSTFFDPNFAGIFLTLFFIFILVLRDSLFSRKYYLLSYLLLILNFIAIILTFSRGAYLMLGISILTYSLITKNWKLIGGILMAFLFAFVLLMPRFSLESTNLLRTASIESRIQSSQDALVIWQENPMGIGFNALRYAKVKYSDSNNKSHLISNAGAGVDNSYIFVLVTTGVLGLLSYIYLLYKIFSLGWVNLRKNKFALILVVSLTGLLVNALTINSLFYSYFLIWIFVLAGFTESTSPE